MPKKYVCINKCYTDRIWEEGEFSDRKINEHFIIYKEPEVVLTEDGEPETLKELQEREAEDFLKGSRNGGDAVQGKTGQDSSEEEVPGMGETVLEIPDADGKPEEESPLG